MLALFPSSSSSAPRPSNPNSLSLNAAPPPIAPKPGSAPELPIFAAIEDDLRDARRVSTHGEEEDLRSALQKVIGRVEELSTLLREAYRTTTDLEASLGVARSNLTLVQSNNEMLEEALKSGNAKDVGWRRWSAREGQQQQQQQQLLHRAQSENNKSSKSLDYAPLSATSSDSTASPSYPSPQTNLHSSSPIMSSPLTSPSVVPPTPATSSEPRFFRSFRFGTASGASTPVSRSSRSPTRSQAIANGTANAGPSNLTSPSLPSLVSKDLILEREKEKERERVEKEKEREKRLEELSKELEEEREAKMKAAAEKVALEAEIESLSQALFEEANKMVATERIKRAETEEELQEARMEQEALKSALKLVETENGRLRRGSMVHVIPSISASIITEKDGTEEDAQEAADAEEIAVRRRGAIGLSGISMESDPEQGPSSRSSSRIGVKSPTTSRRSSSISAAPEVSTEPEPTHGGSQAPSASSPSLDEYSTPSGSMSCSRSELQSQSCSDPQSDWEDQTPTIMSDPTPQLESSGDLSLDDNVDSTSPPFSLPEPLYRSSGSYLAEMPSPWA